VNDHQRSLKAQRGTFIIIGAVLLVLAVATAGIANAQRFPVFQNLFEGEYDELPYITNFSGNGKEIAVMPTQSMIPTLDFPDILICEYQSFAELEVGDIIFTYACPDSLCVGGGAIHRIIKIEESQIFTKGDANEEIDTFVTTSETYNCTVIGKVLIEENNVSEPPIEPELPEWYPLDLAYLESLNNPVEECAEIVYGTEMTNFIIPHSPYVINVVDSITYPEMSDWRKVEAIYEWVTDRFEYEVNGEITATSNIFEHNQFIGDCNEISNTFVSLVRAAEIDAYVVHTDYFQEMWGEEYLWYHAYPIVKIEGYWVSLEVSSSAKVNGVWYMSIRPFITAIDDFDSNAYTNVLIFNGAEAFKCA